MNKLTDTQMALLTNIANEHDYARWTARNEKQFLYAGVAIFSLRDINPCIKRGLIAIEAGVGLDKGFDFLVITDAGRKAIGIQPQRDAANEAKRIVVDDGVIRQGEDKSIEISLFNGESENWAVVRQNGYSALSLYENQLDQAIALLTAAKAELARRSETAVQS